MDTVRDFNAASSRQATIMIRLTWAIAGLTVMMTLLTLMMAWVAWIQMIGDSGPRPGAGRADQNEELNALRLSDTCAAAAEKFWQRGGYERMRSNASGSFAYTSHYNTRTKKCYVTTRLHSSEPNGLQSTLEWIYDAVDGVLIGSLLSKAANASEQQKPTSLSYRDARNSELPETPTPENVARFRRLMIE
jgi:hypothetical protein